MGDGRRVGDWQNRSHDEANSLVGQNPKKWYDQTFWIVVLLLAFWIVFFLLVFWPVGIVLVWRSDWHVAAKVAASVFVAVCVYVVWNMNQAVMAMGY